MRQLRRFRALYTCQTEPESKLARKGTGKEAKLCFSGHALMDNSHGLCDDLRIAEASGRAEREEAMKMLRRLRRRGFQPRTLGADKGYDAGRFPHEVLALGIEPHIAVNEHASRTSPARKFVKHRRYDVSQRIRKRVGKSSEGRRASAACERRSTRAENGCGPPSTWSPPPTTCYASAGSLRRVPVEGARAPGTPGTGRPPRRASPPARRGPNRESSGSGLLFQQPARRAEMRLGSRSVGRSRR